MTKKKLKERLIDICNGAGLEWLEDGQYFEHHEESLECVGNVIQAIERAFNLPDNKRLRLPWRLKDYADIDSLVDLVNEAILYDLKD